MLTRPATLLALLSGLLFYTGCSALTASDASPETVTVTRLSR